MTSHIAASHLQGKVILSLGRKWKIFMRILRPRLLVQMAFLHIHLLHHLLHPARNKRAARPLLRFRKGCHLTLNLRLF